MEEVSKEVSEFVSVGDGIYVKKVDVEEFVNSLQWHRLEGHTCRACESDDLWGRRTAWPTSEAGLLGFFQHYVKCHDGLKEFQKFLKK